LITKALLGGLTVAAIAAPALAATPPVDTYRFAPVVESGKVTALSVTITLPADADGETRLRLPQDWGGGERLWRFIKDPVVTGGTLSTPDEKTWTITSKPRAPLTVRYRVISAYDGEPPVDSVTYAQPIIGPDGFYVVSHTIFAEPEGRDHDQARFVWDPAGSGLRIASDLERLETAPGRLSDIGPSVILAGKDLRIVQRDIGGAPLRLAARGAFSFTDDGFADMAARTINALRVFWGDTKGARGGEPFLITLAPLDAQSGWRSFRGSGLGDAFAVISTRSQPLDDYRVFLAHEYFHTWNPNQTGGLADGPTEPMGYWFSEGFTDYYARRLALRSGLIDLTAFVAAWNEALEAYAISPARTMPNAEIAARFWGDGSVHKLPYQRGAQIALLMESRLSAKGGLDPVMRAMRDYAGRHDPAGWGRSAANLFPRIVQEKTGIDVTAELDRYATRGEAIVLPADAFGGCLSVETITRPIFDAGFDLAATRKTRIVSGVVPGGPAYAAGLRDGMAYLGRDGGRDGDGSVEAGYAVNDGATKRVIRYMPRGDGTVSVQRVTMPKDLTPEARAACMKAVAG
jgi:predicted metalloprotease with PDZ domain